MSIFDDALNKRKAALFASPNITGRPSIQQIGSTSSLYTYVGGTAITFTNPNGVFPAQDNYFSFGYTNFRWTVIYAGSGTINTSDEREKQQIEEIPESWLRAWGEVKYVRFKFNDAVELKGDGARWHVGFIAQRVKEAFERNGINPFEIGLLCFDKWNDTYEKTVVYDESANESEELRLIAKAGERYGIRYEQALALECAYLRWKLGA